MNQQEQLINKLEVNERKSQPLETTEKERSDIRKAVIQYAEEFLNNLSGRKAYEQKGYDRLTEDTQFEIDNKKYRIENLLSFLKHRVDGPGINPASGGHLGYIPGGGLYESSLGDYIAAVTNRYAGLFYASPGMVRLENALINWTGKLIGYPPGFGGNLTSGGSIGNLIAISTARDAFLLKGKNLHKTVIYLTQHTHHSIQKALKLCGLNECIIRIIDLDQDFHLDSGHLNKRIEEDKKENLHPFLIVSNAGSTDTGSIDPLEDIAAIAEHHNCWLHVDAAYGGFFLLTGYGQQELKGIEKCDSVILDPHKGLFLPYGLGMILVKNIHHLASANNYTANYMQDARQHQDEFSPSDLSPELSKHSRGLRMWLPLKIHGIEPFKSALEEKLGLARYFYEQVRQLGFETGPYPDLSIVVFRYVPEKSNPNEFNKRILNSIHGDGRIFISSTTINNNFMLRAAILSHRTHKKHIDEFLVLLKVILSKSNE